MNINYKTLRLIVPLLIVLAALASYLPVLLNLLLAFVLAGFGAWLMTRKLTVLKD